MTTYKLNFQQTRQDLYREQCAKRDRGEYMFVTRATVLGRMHEQKQTLFELDGDVEETMTRSELIQFLMR